MTPMSRFVATINLPECKRGEDAEFPDTPRTAVLVARGILLRTKPAILGAEPAPPPYADGVPQASVDGPEADEAPPGAPLDPELD